MPTRSEALKSRLQRFVDGYVGHVSAQLTEQSMPPAHADFIDGLTRQIGHELVQSLADPENEFCSNSKEGEYRPGDAELGCNIAVLSLAAIACRSVRLKDSGILRDLQRVLPVGVELADEYRVFIASEMLTDESKCSNIWARTHALILSWIDVPQDRTAEFRQHVAELTKSAEAAGDRYVAQSKVERELTQTWVNGLKEAFPSDPKEPGDGAISGCLVWLIIIGAVAYWWQH
ncbi:MAG: hypothetical protein KDA88_14655 [Planctomycetaceae bacterium]|nr:hypothetical protein [Planctomycetaceae bacterium]MCB9953618.1 hypothetical protein [Planctomycetaceae bacterium]